MDYFFGLSDSLNLDLQLPLGDLDERTLLLGLKETALQLFLGRAVRFRNQEDLLSITSFYLAWTAAGLHVRAARRCMRMH